MRKCVCCAKILRFLTQSCRRDHAGVPEVRRPLRAGQIRTSISGQGLQAPASDLEKVVKSAHNGTQGGGETVIVACANRPQPSHEVRSPHRLRVFILGSSHLSPLSPSGIPAM